MQVLFRRLKSWPLRGRITVTPPVVLKHPSPLTNLHPPPHPKPFDRTRKSNKTPTCFPFKTDHVRGSTNLTQCSQHICLRSVNQHVHCWPLQKLTGSINGAAQGGLKSKLRLFSLQRCIQSQCKSALPACSCTHSHHALSFRTEKPGIRVWVCIFIIACLHSKHPN